MMRARAGAAIEMFSKYVHVKYIYIYIHIKRLFCMLCVYIRTFCNGTVY